MPRTIKIAAVQMFAQPAPTAERLQRAERLVAQAAGSGAQLVVLPEVFNTGYEYRDENYGRAEPMDGPTVTWMKDAAAKHGVHLAGTLMLLDAEDIYNALLLVAPDGRVWRYDKNYPWSWERAYFREGRDVTVADTDLGKLGLMICWDSAHPELWARYAGKVDAMVISSCPPIFQDFTLILPDGRRVAADEMGPVLQQIKRTSSEMFGVNLRQQASFLGVPVVNTTGAGRFSSPVPAPEMSMMGGAMLRPDLWPHVSQAEEARMEAGYFQETYVADAAGTVLAKVPTETEGCVAAEVTLADESPQPQGKQPRYGISGFAYMMDVLVNALMVPVYRRSVRRAYGPRMAPVSVHTQVWLGALAAVGTFGYLMGVLARGKRRWW